MPTIAASTSVSTKHTYWAVHSIWAVFYCCGARTDSVKQKALLMTMVWPACVVNQCRPCLAAPGRALKWLLQQFLETIRLLSSTGQICTWSIKVVLRVNALTLMHVSNIYKQFPGTNVRSRFVYTRICAINNNFISLLALIAFILVTDFTTQLWLKIGQGSAG